MWFSGLLGFVFLQRGEDRRMGDGGMASTYVENLQCSSFTRFRVLLAKRNQFLG